MSRTSRDRLDDALTTLARANPPSGLAATIVGQLRAESRSPDRPSRVSPLIAGVAAAVALVALVLTLPILLPARPTNSPAETAIQPSAVQPSEQFSQTPSLSPSPTAAPPSASTSSVPTEIPTASATAQSTPNTIRIAAAPLGGPLSPRFHSSAVWSGTELLVWGGTTASLSFQAPSFSDGAAYDPVADEWRNLADAPLHARSRQAAVWTGTEMLLWGGSDQGSGFLLDGEDPGFTDGAAYDPAHDSWRKIADAPFGWVNNAASIWTGTDWIVAVSSREGDTPQLEFMAYNAGSDSWRLLPPITSTIESETSLAWTGRDLIVRNLGTGAFRLEGMTGEWLPMPDTPDHAGINSNLLWTGDELFAITIEALGGEDYRQLLIGWTPERDAWRVVSEPPTTVNDATMISADGHLLLAQSGLAYDFASGAWSNFVTPDAAIRTGAVEVWMSDSLAIWGGGREADPSVPFDNGLVLTVDW
jgi:hypothetical protein